MAANKLFLVIKHDSVIQATGYLVRAHSESHAADLVDAGMYIEETKPEILDTLATSTVSVEEINVDAEGQDRK